jgi:DNA-directed RNA polymerase subunit RPC12/RpoP
MADFICNNCGTFIETDETRCVRCGVINCRRCISANGGKCPDCGSRIDSNTRKSSIRNISAETRSRINRTPSRTVTRSYVSSEVDVPEFAFPSVEKPQQPQVGFGALLLRIVLMLTVFVGLMLAAIYFLPPLNNKYFGFIIIKIIGLLVIVWLGLAFGNVSVSLVISPLAILANLRESREILIKGLQAILVLSTLGIILVAGWVGWTIISSSIDAWRMVYISVALLTTFWGSRSCAAEATKNVRTRKMEWE